MNSDPAGHKFVCDQTIKSALNCFWSEYPAFEIVSKQSALRSSLISLSCDQHPPIQRSNRFDSEDPALVKPSMRLSCSQNGLFPGWGARLKFDMSRPSQMESVYVQNLPDGKCLCPDFRAFKIFRAFIVRSKLPMSDFRAFKILYDQTLVRSKLKFVRSFVRSKTPMSRLSCVQTCLCPDFRAFKIFRAFIVRSKLPMSDFRAFKILYDHFSAF